MTLPIIHALQIAPALTLAAALFAPEAARSERRDAAIGLYRLEGVHEAASMLEVSADGRWRYALSYGALDEQADGRWRRAGIYLILNTDPRPVPPAFSLRTARPADAPVLHVRVTGPDGRGIAGIDILVRFDRGEPVRGYTQEYGWEMPLSPARKPLSITLSLDMHGVAGRSFPLHADRDRQLDFLFRPNDLGRPDFDHLPVEVEENALVMLRDGARLRYVRVKD